MTYKQFLTVRVVGGILLALIVLWGLWAFLGMFEKGERPHVVQVEEGEPLHGAEEAQVPAHPEAVPSAREAPHGAPEATILHEAKAKGVAFVEATISVFDYELNERFGGWRRNDILRFTDNVENIQLGVLEVVRRASVTLAERIARHGPSDVLDENLENAMNWFMVRPDRYWLPSPENKYNDGLNELRAYAKKLERGEARFYTRSDNLIPLFMSFAEILGSCDENLVKHYEEDGTPVSWFKVDDYFYYSKGVAKAMGKILHAVEVDFSEVLEARHAMDMLEGAIHACHIGAELDPWLVTDASLDGILANHRANMATSIAHAAYYVNVLIKTLST